MMTVWYMACERGTKMKFDLQKMHNEYDMLKGCVNRMFITNERDELPGLYESAEYYLNRINEMAGQRLDEKEKRKNEAFF